MNKEKMRDIKGIMEAIESIDGFLSLLKESGYRIGIEKYYGGLTYTGSAWLGQSVSPCVGSAVAVVLTEKRVELEARLKELVNGDEPAGHD